MAGQLIYILCGTRHTHLLQLRPQRSSLPHRLRSRINALGIYVPSSPATLTTGTRQHDTLGAKHQPEEAAQIPPPIISGNFPGRLKLIFGAGRLYWVAHEPGICSPPHSAEPVASPCSAPGTDGTVRLLSVVDVYHFPRAHLISGLRGRRHDVSRRVKIGVHGLDLATSARQDDRP